MIAVAAATLALGGCASEPSAEPVETTPPEPLTVSKAGTLYLDAVCPLDEAWGEVDVELDRLRIAVGRGDTDTSTFAKAMDRLADASKHASELLDAPGQSWPEEAEDEIAAVRKTIDADEKQAKTVAKMPASQAVNYAWEGAADIGASATAARAVLGLPSDPDAACAQWKTAGSNPE